MVTYFNRKDLVSFGEYLLSEKRINRVKLKPDGDDNIDFNKRLKDVHHADIENWLDEISKQDLSRVNKQNVMLAEFLDKHLSHELDGTESTIEAAMRLLSEKFCVGAKEVIQQENYTEKTTPSDKVMEFIEPYLQPKPDVSDEEIIDSSLHLKYREHQIAYTSGAKWMRNKLTKK